MSPNPDLSVVVPVYNTRETIRRLASQLVSIDELDVELVFVDDASTDGSGKTLDQLTADHASVKALHHDPNRGAGEARNTGFDAASGRYTLFFDADDLIRVPAVVTAVRGLDRSNADVAVMPYRYQRSSVLTHQPMNIKDQEIWRMCIGDAHERVTRLADVPQILEFTNYPWNKIIRTATFKEVGLRFGRTPVHNDMLGHWYSLLFADQLLLLDEIVCTHIVERSGVNLTNQQLHLRLALFDALDEVYDLLESMPALRNKYSHNYWSFVVRVSGWAGSQINPTLTEDFNERLQQHMLRIDLLDFARIRMRRSPELADEIVRKAFS
jgi:glycosyltransferase involved in cell wall biosynthesis